MSMVKKIGAEAIFRTYEPISSGPPGKGVGGFLKELVSEVNSYQEEAEENVSKFLSGGNVEVHDVMIALEKADLSMEFLVQLRNKLLEAYQEIMRTQL